MRGFVRTVNWLSRICGYISAGLIVGSILIVCQLVFLRYVLNASTVWQTEVVIFMMVAATLIGAPYVQHLRGHVNVDLIPLYMKGRTRLALDIVAKLAMLAVIGVLAWYSALLTYDAWAFTWRTPSVWGPQLWLPYLAMPIGFGVLCLQVVADLIGLFTGQDKPFGIEDEEL